MRQQQHERAELSQYHQAEQRQRQTTRQPVWHWPLHEEGGDQRRGEQRRLDQQKYPRGYERELELWGQEMIHDADGEHPNRGHQQLRHVEVLDLIVALEPERRSSHGRALARRSALHGLPPVALPGQSSAPTA